MNFYLWTRMLCLFAMVAGISIVVSVPWFLLHNIGDEVNELRKSNSDLKSKGTDRCKGSEAECQGGKGQKNVPDVFECSTDYVNESFCACPLEESCSVARPSSANFSCEENAVKILYFDDEDELFLTDELFPAARIAVCA